MTVNGQPAGRWIIAILSVGIAAGGCAVKFAQRSPWDIQQIQALSQQLEQFRSLAQLKGEEADRLRDAKALLESRLSSEIAHKDIAVGFDERGLVLRALDQVLFDSGKATIRQEAKPILDKVARVLSEELPDQPIGIEGHTDNQPIRRSGWKDNWELSLARARAVVTYLVEKQGVDPRRVAATGYGEYRPIASNGSATGRRANRRVEIVVWPKGTELQSGKQGAASSGAPSSYIK